MTEQSSIAKAQRHNISQLTMQDLINPTQFRAKAQFAMFQPYYEERLLYRGSTLPDLKVHFSKIEVKKPPQDGKEWYQGVLQFSSTGTSTKETRIALGNQLMSKLQQWTMFHTNKSLMDLTFSDSKGRILLHYANIHLHPQRMKQAAVYHYVNQGIMDQIADKLLLAWSPSFTNFVMHMTLHDE